VVPVALEFDGDAFWVGGNGESVLATRKVRNVVDGNRHVALVIDDMVSFDPFIARGTRVYAVADPPLQRHGLVGPGFYIRVRPLSSWSWNMESQPVGDSWYPARGALHQRATGASSREGPPHGTRARRSASTGG
jgi:pyridoxamine 5'-phosphate oxidase family protein